MKTQTLERHRPWWWAVIIGQKYTLVTPLSLEECGRILLAANRRTPGPWWSSSARRNRMLVDVLPEQKGRAKFYIHRDAGTNLTAEILGHMEVVPDGTLVTWRGRMGFFPMAFMIFHASIFIFIFSQMPGGLESIPPLFMIYPFLTAIVVAERSNLERVPRRILAYGPNANVKKKKRKRTA